MMIEQWQPTKEELALIFAWKEEYATLLGRAFLDEALDTGDPIAGVIKLADVFATTFSLLGNGDFPLTGRLPGCPIDNCDNSDWNKVMCNVDEKTCALIKKLFNPMDDTDNKFEEIYGSLLSEILKDK
jgi:hypothetical protein